jgi:hypothetical protein
MTNNKFSLMSYIKIELPHVNLLKKELTKDPNRIKFYLKYDGFGGDIQSVNFLNKKITEYKSQKSSNSKEL